MLHGTKKMIFDRVYLFSRDPQSTVTASELRLRFLVISNSLNEIYLMKRCQTIEVLIYYVHCSARIGLLT